MLELPFEPPVQPLHISAWKNAGVEVFIKREDLIHPFISGNKWRKLKYVLSEAKNISKNHLISFGGAYSNHLVSLACAGATHQFKTTAFVRGEEVNNYILGLCKLWGMKLIFVSREDYRDKENLYETYFKNNADCMMIDEGGRGELAMKGCEEILENINDFSHVCCAVGTGTTLAGLAKAAHQKQIIAEGFCVLKGAEAISDDIQKLIGNDIPFTLHHRFHFGGYGKSDNENLQFIQTMASQTGVLFDHVYTAKMMRGIDTLIRENYYPKGSRILAVHTGGLLGLLSQF